MQKIFSPHQEKIALLQNAQHKMIILYVWPYALECKLGFDPSLLQISQLNIQNLVISHSFVGSRAVIDTVFRVDISEVHYATCRYIINNIQTHVPF